MASARLRAGTFDSTLAVNAADKFIAFESALPAGRLKAQTWLLGKDGKEVCGAYYVYVSRISD